MTTTTTRKIIETVRRQCADRIGRGLWATHCLWCQVCDDARRRAAHLSRLASIGQHGWNHEADPSIECDRLSAEHFGSTSVETLVALTAVKADLTLDRQFAAACLQAIRRDKSARREIG